MENWGYHSLSEMLEKADNLKLITYSHNYIEWYNKYTESKFNRKFIKIKNQDGFNVYMLKDSEKT